PLFRLRVRIRMQSRKRKRGTALPFQDKGATMGGCWDSPVPAGGGRITMASELIVRHGAMRFLGSFEADAEAVFRRGDGVVVRTDRGLEDGEVLCETSPRAVAFLVDPTHGRIVRHLTDEDR